MVSTKFLGIMALVFMGGLVTACGDDDDDIEDIVDERIDDLDLDDDLVVTRSEWNDAFVVWDDDNDQVLVINEFRFNGGGFAAADVNDDGFVTGDEWEELLDDWDIDDNEVLEEFEFEPYL